MMKPLLLTVLYWFPSTNLTAVIPSTPCKATLAPRSRPGISKSYMYYSTPCTKYLCWKISGRRTPGSTPTLTSDTVGRKSEMSRFVVSCLCSRAESGETRGGECKVYQLILSIGMPAPARSQKSLTPRQAICRMFPERTTDASGLSNRKAGINIEARHVCFVSHIFRNSVLW